MKSCYCFLNYYLTYKHKWLCLISLILFKSQWTEPITSEYICDIIFCLWQNWSKVEKKNPLLEILCDERTYRVLPYILWLLPESETSLLSEIASELTEHATNLQMSISKYFPSAKEEVSWVKNPFSASTEDVDLPLREVEQLIDIVADRNQIDTFKPWICLNFVLYLQVNTQTLQSMVDNTCCFLFQHTALRQQFWNTLSLRKSKELDLILKQMCGSSYPISNPTSKTDLWKASTSISFVTRPVQWRE